MEDRISNKSVWNNKQRQEIEFLNLFCEHMLAFYSANTKFIPYNVTIDFFKKQKTRAQQLMKSSVVNAFKLIRFLYNPSTTSDKTWWKFCWIIANLHGFSNFRRAYILSSLNFRLFLIFKSPHFCLKLLNESNSIFSLARYKSWFMYVSVRLFFFLLWTLMQSAKNVYSPEDIMRQYRQIRNNGVSNQSTVNNLAENFKKLVVNWGREEGWIGRRRKKK